MNTKIDSKKKINYKTAGVDVAAGDELVDWLQSALQKDKDQKLLYHEQLNISGIGGFASIFRWDFPKYKKPCIVTCTDGVGTKVLLAQEPHEMMGIGQDLVAMCVNDLLCCGGRPLFFLDYYATGHLNLEQVQGLLQGIRRSCALSLCDLVGGETAEMPGLYKKGDYDCAGFAVGIVDEDRILGPTKVKEQDRVLGISSSGFHSNGYSLLRKVFEKDLESWKAHLLVPTRIYVKPLLELFENIEVHAAAHITGGGVENIPRVIPESLQWERTDWPWPKPFLEVQKRTGMNSEDMLRTLNCGVGFVLILPETSWETTWCFVQSQGWEPYDLGRIVRKEESLSKEKA